MMVMIRQHCVAILQQICLGVILFMPASPVQSKQFSECNVQAYIVDRDPKGANLRKQATTASPIVIAIPQESKVRINGGQGSWVSISAYADTFGDMNRHGNAAVQDWRPVQGWMMGELVGIGVRRGPLRKSPSPEAGIITGSEELLPDSTGRILECSGSWVKVKMGDGLKSGWLAPELQCENPLTTCP